jgi:SAM-dependent methyltransferase
MQTYTGTDNLEVMEEAVNYNEFLLSLIRNCVSVDDHILDFGAGIGTFAKALSGEGYKISCLEPDATQARLINAAGVPVATRLDDIDDESLDVIYSLNVLEHIEEDGAILTALHGKLRPGGRILIYVPAFHLLYSSMDRKVGHVRRYTRSGAIAKLRAARFENISACYADSIGFFASLLFRLIGNSEGNINRKALVFYDRLVFPFSRLCDRFLNRILGKNIVATASKSG